MAAAMMARLPSYQKTNVAHVNVGQPVTDVCCRIENERQRFFLIFPSNAVVSEYLLKQT